MYEQPLFIVNCERIKKQSKYSVSFLMNDTLISRIKTLPYEQRKYNPYTYSWEITTKGLYNIIKIYKNSKKIKFEFGENRNVFAKQIQIIDIEEKEKKKQLKTLIANKKIWNVFKEKLEVDHSDKIQIVHKNLKKGVKLFPFQVVAAVFLNTVKSALLSLEMGTGKSICSIAYIEMNNYKKVIVITPNSLKHNFYNEIEKFTKSKAHIINWKKNKYTIEESKYIIVNYEFFNRKDSKVMDKKFKNLNIGKIDVLIADESTKLKNTKSNTYRNYKRIFKKNIFVDGKISKLFLSGTPAPNRAYELYTVLNQISSIEFPTKRFFYENYCGLEYDAGVMGGWTSNVENLNLEELYNKISPYTYRKRKKDVLKDLPDKIYQRIILEMTSEQQEIYDDIELGVANEIITEDINNPLTIMIRLRQYTSSLKINHLKEIIDRLLYEDEKIVIVDVFKDVLYQLHELYPEVSALHTGDQTVEERAEIVKNFQDINGKTKIFLGSIQTCNYGLTLTAANKLFIITLPYSVGEYDQVSDRCVLNGELVLTKNRGYIPIENVNIDDLVYTHKGNWKKVINIKSRLERNKPFYDIKYKGFYKPLRCTYDHKIYIYDIMDNSYKWVIAKNLDLFNHYMVLNKVNIQNYDKEFFVNEHKTKKKKHPDFISINKNVKLTNDLLYAFGRFIGDGWVSDNDVSICGHIKEYKNVKKCIDTIKKSFNIKNYGERLDVKKNGCTCFIYSKELTINFENWFGKRALNKKIPDFVFHLSKNKIRSLLNGYYDADGYRRRNTQQASTVSKYLSYQLVLLENMLGNTSTIRYNDNASSWSFEYSINNKISKPKLIKNNEGNVHYPIQDIKIHKAKRHDERVYDLEVKDDSSFVVGLSTVHNCHRISQKSTVNIYPLIFADTIDDYVFDMIESKRKEIIKVIDNEDYTSKINESVIGELIARITMKHGSRV